MDYFSLPWTHFIGVIAFIAAVTTSAHAVLRRRDPRAALWWVGVVWVIPLAGSLLYYAFGINRIERTAARMRRKRKPSGPPPSDVCLRCEASPPLEAAKHLLSLERLVEGVVHMPVTAGNQVRALVNGDEAYPEMINAIDAAQHTIGLGTYIFNLDLAGQAFVDALARAVKRNVQVRVLIDDVGSGFSWRSVYRALIAKNVPVAYFHPTVVPWRMAYLNLRNHRKVLTVDGRVAFTGGMNIHEGHIVKTKSKSKTQDVHFRIEGPVVAQMQEAFRIDWHFTTGERLQGDDWFPRLVNAGEVYARCIADGPDEDFEKCRWTMLGAIAHARKSIRIVTPYFVPDQSIITALNVAAMSGVLVDIVLPKKNDLALVNWASQAMLWQVLQRGCRVWRTPPPFDHTKLLVVDGGWTLFGSSNWDVRSLRLNFELNVECYNELLAKQMEQWVDEKIATAKEVTLAQVDARRLPIKLRDGVARLFTPLL